MASNLALFVKSLFSATAVVTAATTDTSAPVAGNLALLYTASSANGELGALISRVTAKPRATIAAAQLQLYRSLDGATFTFIEDALLTAYPGGTGVAAPKADFGYTRDNPLQLAPGERLYAGSAVALAAGIVFRAEGGAV